MTGNLRARVTVGDNNITVQTGVQTQAPGRFDFDIQQGGTLSLKLTWIDDTRQVVDVSAYTARLKIKEHWDSTTTQVSLTSSDGITLAAAAPNITIARTASATAAYTGWTRGVYDLELVSGTTVTRLLEGYVVLRKEVTT